MNMEILPDSNNVKINLEVDFGDRGGIQRFKTLADISKWIQEEVKFWSWLSQGKASEVSRSLPLINNTFFQYDQAFKQAINEFNQNWNSVKTQIDTLIQKGEVSDQDINRYKQLKEESGTVINRFQSNLQNAFKSHILPVNRHRIRTEPISQFIKELSENSPDEAVYALDQVLRDNNGRNDKATEASGRLLASLFEKNLNRKLRPDNRAFKAAIETWSDELKSYKEDYDSLKASYKDLVANNAKTDANWKTRTQEMDTEFSEQIEKNNADLTNLKEAYDSYMSLAAPRNYWAKKSVEHGRRIQDLRKYITVCASIGIVILGAAAYCLLPEFYPKDSIPWRNLALFLLITTFVIWPLKLIVKLLLSNIHLYSDARERVVMIQTFMALVRSKKDGDGLEKADLALVLAPIFKPSTTGVIKDDGGPITLTDFISRLGEK